MGDSKDKKGKIVIISGPSGVGKSTICKQIVASRDDICLSVSMTTRPKSEAEIDGHDYWFVSKEQFQERISEGSFLEYAEVFGHMYGTPRDKVEQMLQCCKTVILEIDVQGARQVKVFYPDAVMIFILPPSAKVLAERLNHRGREAAEVAEQRLGGAGTEIAAAWQYYEHMVVNEDLQQAVNECLQIIEDA
ncbi:MAG: guanylate kinase [Sedimentisphaerales bacterium]|nr:guanylate kinase [Sedimentisphaerales bacterium]